MALKPISSKDLAKSRSFKDIGMAFGKNPFTDDVKNILLTHASFLHFFF